MTTDALPTLIVAGDQRCPRGAKRVIYWMQQAQRAKSNPALELCVGQATERSLPLCAVFVLSDQIPDANLRHYGFMLEGLAELGREFHRLGIPFYLLAGDPLQLLPALAGDDSYVVMDNGCLRWQREWRAAIAKTLPEGNWCIVETETVVPVQVVSGKEEYSAATLRGKILRQVSAYLEITSPRSEIALPEEDLRIPAGIHQLRMREGVEAEKLLSFAREHLKLDESVLPSHYFRSGYGEARRRLETFLEQNLERYACERNDPAKAVQSELSPYLHFGQISAREVALAALDQAGMPASEVPFLIRSKENPVPLQAGLGSFLEELIVRRELACNFCQYNPDYDNYACVPVWARQTLNNHLLDPRPALYTPQELETASTQDPYWNAAQREMVLTGKMHNYLRMYWGKKIIEWTPDPESAFQIMLWLNNKYELDGRDPNSYAGVAWCFGKHDRPWQERAVFGGVRYMNAAGLERKFDMRGYLDRNDALI